MRRFGGQKPSQSPMRRTERRKSQGKRGPKELTPIRIGNCVPGQVHLRSDGELLYDVETRITGRLTKTGTVQQLMDNEYSGQVRKVLYLM